jgi:hypothetical protein
MSESKTSEATRERVKYACESVGDQLASHLLGATGEVYEVVILAKAVGKRDMCIATPLPPAGQLRLLSSLIAQLAATNEATWNELIRQVQAAEPEPDQNARPPGPDSTVFPPSSTNPS